MVPSYHHKFRAKFTNPAEPDTATDLHQLLTP